MLLLRTAITSLSELKEEPAVLSGIVSDFPEEKKNSIMLTLDLERNISALKENKLKGSIIIYIRKDSLQADIKPGDKIIISCTPVKIENRGNPFEFDYRFYMLCRRIKYYAFATSGDLVSIIPPANRSVKHIALIARNRIIGMFNERGIKGKRLALVSAITLGERSHLDRDQKQYFINAGIMHIMAVSGLHAIILCYFIFSLLFFLKGRLNIVRIAITLLLLWAFAFVTGLTPSVLRATFMFSFLQAGKLLKRPANPVNSVLASAFILILINPCVIFDAGFLLSYSAVLYIIIFYSDLHRLLKFKHHVTDLIWESAAVTITAQAGTLPLTIMLFNRFPTWFIITNVVIVPVSSLLIIAGVLVPLTFPVAWLSGFIAKLLDMLTWLTEYLTEKAAGLPYATISNIGITMPEYIFLTLSVSLLMWYFFKRPRIQVFYPLLSVLLFSISFSARYILTSNCNELIVYNINGGTATGIRCGHQLNLYTDTETVPGEVNRHSSVTGLKIVRKNVSDKPVFLSIGYHTIIIAGSYDPGLVLPRGADFLVFTSANPFPSDKILPAFPAKSTVITVSSAQIPGKKEAVKLSEYTLWQVRKSGAYRKRL